MASMRIESNGEIIVTVADINDGTSKMFYTDGEKLKVLVEVEIDKDQVFIGDSVRPVTPELAQTIFGRGQ